MKDLLNRHHLRSVTGLELLARTVLAGIFVGGNRSQKSGAGLEFNQYRSYQPGDDIRLLDWKMYARSDRYYIKEAELESNITTRILLDTSASMAHQDGQINKLDYARGLAACLAYLAFSQGDAIGLYAINDAKISQVMPRQDKSQLGKILYDLVKVEPKGKFPQKNSENPLQIGRGKELIIFISDLYQADEEIMKVIKRLSGRRHETIVFHIMGGNEMNFSYDGIVTFQDLESGEKVKINTALPRDAYQALLNEYLDAIKKELLQMNVSYNLFEMHHTYHDALRNFLMRRMRLL